MRYLMMLAFIMLLGCPNTPVNPTPDADASGIDAAIDSGSSATFDCASWCAHASDMKCQAAIPTEHGASCVDVCKNTLDGPMPFAVQCRSLASSCAAADECENGPSLARRRRPPMADASIVTCADWCTHAADMKCPEARATPKGALCIEVCNNVQSGPAPFNLKCRTAAKTCAAADSCER